MIRGLLIIFACLFAGELIGLALPIPIPGNVIGMIVLTLALSFRVVRLADVKPVADALVRHMAFFFVPPGVGLMLYFDLIRAEAVAIVVALVASTFLVLAIVGLLQQRLEGRRD